MTSPRRKFVLIPAGSAGDTYPFVWLGRGLASLGHEVVAVVHRPFDRTMREAGLRAVACGTDEDYGRIIGDPDLWHPRRGLAAVARAAARLYPEVVPRIKAELDPGRTLLVAGGIAFGARIAAEAFATPLATVQLQPAAFLSVDDPPVPQAGMEWFCRAPRWLRTLLYKVGYLRADRLLAPSINAYRAELGLGAPVRSVLREYWHSPLRVLALFPEWYCRMQADWPPQALVTRFPLYDEGDRIAVPPALAAFLDAGQPPVLFTPGSANVQARGFFAAGLDACRRLGLRAVFVTRFPDQLPSPLPAEVCHAAYVPFSRVFPRCRAVVHHGGIGTVAQGLAAGVPQLVMAMSHDQPDNGHRLARLGVGAYLYPRAFTGERVAAALARLTASSDVAQACRACRALADGQMPGEAVFRLLEDAHRSACG